MAEIQVDGIKQLVRALNKGGHEDLVQMLKDANLEAAKDIETVARPLIPKRTGALANSLRSSGTKRAGIVRAGKAKIPYAGPIHFGWPNRPNALKGWRGGPIAPNTFLYDALDKRADAVLEIYLKRVQEIADMIESST